MIQIIREGLNYAGAPLMVDQVKSFDAATEDAFIATGNAMLIGKSAFGSVAALAQQNTAVTAPNDTNENTLYTVAIPGGAMGPNGSIRVSATWTCTNNANAKTLKVKHGGNIVLSTPAASGAGTVQYVKTSNRNSPNHQVCSIVGSGVTATVSTYTLDTTQTQNVTITAQKAAASDSIILESVLVEIITAATHA